MRRRKRNPEAAKITADLQAYVQAMEEARQSYLRRNGVSSTQIIAYGDLILAAQTLARIYHLLADDSVLREEVEGLVETGFRRLFELALGELQGPADGELGSAGRR